MRLRGYMVKSNLVIKYSIILYGILMLIFIPADLIFDEQLSVCVFRHITGEECPLCGMTRAAYLLLRVKFCASAQYNPLVYFLPFLLLVEVQNDCKVFPKVKIRRIVWYTALLSAVFFFFYRLFFI